MSMLTRHQSVLDLGPDVDTSGKRRIFTREPDDHTDVPDIVYIPTELWIDLGQPDQITITVKAGDQINEHPVSEAINDILNEHNHSNHEH